MVLELLPYKIPKNGRKKLGWIRYIVFLLSLIVVTVFLKPFSDLLDK